MNIYGEYIDIPTIPSDIVLKSEEILALPTITYPSTSQKAKANYQNKRTIKKVNPELKEWLIKHFPFDIVAHYNIYPLLIEPHVDVRSVAYNYIIDTGGEVDTVFYNKVPDTINTPKGSLWNSIDNYHKEERLKRIARIRFEPYRWIKLQTHIPHGTEGKVRRPRIFISVSDITDILTHNTINPETSKELYANW